jgi:biopolymer transport protein ExbD
MPYLRRGFLKSAHRPNFLFCHIDAFPFLALTLVLLIIFMVYSPRHRRVYADLPRCMHAREVPQAVKENSIHISITRDGTL